MKANRWRAKIGSPPGATSFATPRWTSAEFVTSTDYRRKVALDGFVKRRVRPDVPDWQESFIRVAPRFRFSDRLSADYVWSWQVRHNERGWVDVVDDGQLSLFGQRENTSHTHVFNASYIFTPTSSLSARIRHYWSVVDYHGFFELQEDGNLGFIDDQALFASLELFNQDLTSRYDVNYNAWSVDLVYRWIFSRLRVECRVEEHPE